MQKLKLLSLIPHREDATSFYRAALPLSWLYHDYDVDLIIAESVGWSVTCLADVVFIQRPADGTYLEAAKFAQLTRKKVWVDFDDDMLGVPVENRAHPHYSKPEVKALVVEMVALADVVTVSTPHLASRFNEFRFKSGKPECVVIPNAFDDRSLPPRHSAMEPHPLILWRGSDTHQRDLAEVTGGIFEVMHKNPTWSIHFLGYNPVWISSVLPEKRCIVDPGYLNIYEYHSYLQRIQPRVVVVPLSDSPFNRSKSNIAWIEGTYARAVVVAPDFPEWRRPGIINYKGPEDFARATQLAIEESRSRGRAEQSWAWIKQNLLLSKVNEQRWDVLRSLAPEKAAYHERHRTDS